jgi:hypothetical protein
MNNENELDKLAIPILNQILTEAQDKWNNPNSKYISYRKLQIDKRGSFGERILKEFLSKIYYRRITIEYNDGDQGDWDLKYNNIKFEIKTSSLDVNDKFQNEGLKEKGDYDIIFFLGIAPDDLYIKFVKIEDIPFKKLHNREKRKTGRGYKWDFKKEQMKLITSLKEFKDEFEKVVTPNKSK